MQKTAWAVQGVAAAMIAVAVGATLWTSGPRAHVAIPADSASSDDVIAALVKAWDAHDTATVKALYDAQSQDRLTPFDHVRLVAINGSGLYANDPSLAVPVPGEKSMSVGVTLEVHGGNDYDAPDGETGLGLILVRSGPHQAWRVLEAGYG